MPQCMMKQTNRREFLWRVGVASAALRSRTYWAKRICSPKEIHPKPQRGCLTRKAGSSAGSRQTSDSALHECGASQMDLFDYKPEY